MLRQVKLSLVISLFFCFVISALLSSTPVKAFQDSTIGYRVFSDTNGWTDYVINGTEIGGDKLDAISIDLQDDLYAKGSIQYRTHNENIGWYDWVGNNQVVGQANCGIQALRVKLSGQLPYLYDIYYRVHVPSVGWSGWAKNGEPAGSEGLGRNVNYVQISLQRKGDLPAAGQIGNSYTENKWLWPVPGYRSISSYFGPRNSVHHDGFDIAAPSGAPIVSAKAGTVILAAPNGNFGNCVAVTQDSGETVYYAHMSRIGVVPGQKVAAGSVIGYVGTTGNSTGNHLHMEIYNYSGNMTDPLTYY